MQSAPSRFKSPEAAARFRAAYEATLALWPVAHESLEVTTSFGITHLNVAGSLDAPPLVLIHGAQISSPVWFANIEPLSRHYRVFAPDVVDQMGLSLPTRRLRSPRDCSDWLAEVLDGLGIDRAAFVGHSQGGWLVLNLALAAPQRVERMVLLSPAPALLRLHWQTLLHMLPVLAIPSRAMYTWSFQWMTTMRLDSQQPNPLVEQFMVGTKTFRPQELSMGVTSVFTDEELRRITAPTLLLIGDHEVVYSPHKALERARTLIPNVEADLIRDGGHLFPVDQAEAVNARLLDFLGRVHPAPPSVA